jgi:hypothetical protein
MKKSAYIFSIFSLLLFSCRFLTDVTGATDVTVTNSGCDQVSFVSESAYPGELLGVKGIPAEMTELYAEVSVDGDPVGAAFVVPDEEGGFDVMIPLHPIEGIAGGEIEITIKNQEFSCAPITVTVNAIQEAPGAAESYLEKTQQYFDLVWLEYGVTRDELLNGNLDDYPASYVGLAAIQIMLDGPENPDSFARMVEGSAEVFAGQGYDAVLMDALVGHLGLDAFMDEMVFRQYERMLAAQEQMNVGMGGVLAKPALASGNFGTVIGPEELSYFMDVQADCAVALGGAQGRVLADYGLAAAAISLVAPTAGVLISAGLLAFTWHLESCAFLNPSNLTEIKLKVNETVFEEDSKEKGQVISIDVTPVSLPWKLSGLLIDTVLLGAGSVDEFISAVRGAAAAGNAVSTANGTLAGLVNALCSRTTECNLNDLGLVFNNNPWNRVSLVGEEFLEELQISGTAFKNGDSFGVYVPWELGESTLSVWTKSGMFGNKKFRGQETVSVEMITVEIDPGFSELEPGGTVELFATVTNAVDETLEWQVTKPDGSVEVLGKTFQAPHEVPYTTDDFELVPNENECEPPEPIIKYWQFKATSLTNTGPRSRSTEERSGTAMVSVTKEDTNWLKPESCEEVTIDDSLLGYWAVDPDSFKSFLEKAGFGGGEVTINSVDGLRFLYFDDQGNYQSGDRNLNINITTGSTPFTLTLNSDGGGLYTTDQDSVTPGTGTLKIISGSFSQNNTGNTGGQDIDFGPFSGADDGQAIYLVQPGGTLLLDFGPAFVEFKKVRECVINGTCEQ